MVGCSFEKLQILLSMDHKLFGRFTLTDMTHDDMHILQENQCP